MRGLLKTLAKRMKERRKIMGLSQEALAERSGVSSNFIARMETGERTPSLSTLIKLANALGASVSDLLNEDSGGEVGDLVDYVSHLLSGLDENNKGFLLRQFRMFAEHLKAESVQDESE